VLEGEMIAPLIDIKSTIGEVFAISNLICEHPSSSTTEMRQRVALKSAKMTWTILFVPFTFVIVWRWALLDKNLFN
jgi:hypothetical protein